MPKYSEKIGENQGFSRLLMKERAISLDGGNGCENEQVRL
jgi:hypothetical protein